MKKLGFCILLGIFYQLGFAQDAAIDKTKLLDLYQTQRYADAAAYLQTVYPNHTTDLKALGQIAYCNMMAGKLVAAEQNYQQIDSLQPNTLPVLFNLASINAKRGNSQKTRFYLEQIVKLDSLNFNALKQLANFTDSLAEKTSYLKKANGINPTDADVAGDLAICYTRKNLYEPAYLVLKTAMVADTGNFILQQQLLPVANELKKYSEVITLGEKLLQNDQDANVLKDVGKAYFNLKNYEKCIFYYKMIEQMGKQNEVVLYYITLSYRELKNYAMAAQYAKKTIEEGISVNTAAYYALLGDIYESNNQLASSATAYKKGLTFKPTGNIYYRLALLNDLKLNQKVSARTYYNLYLKSKPDTSKEKEQIAYTKGRIAELGKK